MKLRKGCKASKNEHKCDYYSYAIGKCLVGETETSCALIKQPKGKPRRQSNDKLLASLAWV